MEIKQELAKTGISITCVNRDGEVVKNITSNDSKDVEDTEGGNQENPDENKGDTGTTGGRSERAILITVFQVSRFIGYIF